MRPTDLVYKPLAAVLFPPFLRKVMTQGADQLPTTGGFIIAANHVDWLDGFYIAAVVGKQLGVPTHFLSKSNNYWWTTVAIQIPPDRGIIVDTAVRRLQAGQVLCNFPQGERTTDGKLRPGKTGTVRIAAAAGIPVVPLGITCDAGRNMGQSVQFLLSKNHPVHINFGAPLTFSSPSDGMTKGWLTSETARLMRAIAPLVGTTV